MIRENMIWKAEPFLLSPSGKDYIWGGSRLCTEFNKEVGMDSLAETWECSTHPDGPSWAASGIYKGMELSQVLAEHPEYLGKHAGLRPEGGAYRSVGTCPGACAAPAELPILIKLIDAKEDLSVQVHPDDGYARQHEGGQLGKTEMWYVLDAAPGAQLIYGFYHDMTREQLRSSIENGTVERYLQKVPVRKDDVFFIEAGTVHAIGAGALVAEVQESSNLTYRLYDYDRTDKMGNKRPLHIDRALEVADLKSAAEPRQPVRLLRYRKGYASELLCRCRHFQVERYLLNTESVRGLVAFQTSENSFQVFLCLDGCGAVFLENGESFNFFKGDCIFVPADSMVMKMHGKAKFLNVRC